MQKRGWILFACRSAEDVDFRGGSAVAVQRIGAGEAEIAHGFVDVLEVDGLFNGVGAEVGEFPFRRLCPGFSVRAHFKLVLVRHSGRFSVLPGQVGEAGDLVGLAHVHNKGLRRFRFGEPGGFRVVVNGRRGVAGGGVFHLPPGFANAELGLADGTQLAVGELAACLDGAAFLEFGALAVDGGTCLGFAAVRRVQDLVLAVRQDDEVVSAAEDGGPHRACRLAEEGEFRDAGRRLASRDAQAQLLGGDGAVQAAHDLVADGFPFIVDADPFAVDEGVNVEGVYTLAQADLFAEADNVKGGGLGQGNEGGGRQVVVLHGPVGLHVAVRHVGRGEFLVIAARLAGRDSGAQGVVPGIQLVAQLLEFHQGFDVRGVQLAGLVRRHVQDEVGSAAYGVKPHLHELFRGFDAGRLSLVPEPAGMVDGGIPFRRHPAFSAAPAGASASAVQSHRAPVGIVDVAFFRSAPAGVAVVARAPDDAIGLDFADHFHDFFKVVVLFRIADVALFPGSAVVAVPPVGSVKPDFKDGAVVGQQFADLLVVNVQVAFLAVVRIVAVPRAEVSAEFDAVLLAGLGEFLDHVPLAVFPRALGDVVVRGLGGPCAEAVMVLGRINHPLHAAFLEGGDDVGGIEVRRVEDFRIFVPISPFPAREGVQAKVDEAVEFHALPVDLCGSGHRSVGLGRVRGPSGQHGRGENCSKEEGGKLVHAEKNVCCQIRGKLILSFIRGAGCQVERVSRKGGGRG